MNSKWFLFWGCVVLVLGSVAGMIVTQHQRAEAVRGWETATTSLDLPYRLPLAGVNVALTQYLDEDGRLDAELNAIEAAGFTWVRQTFLWAEIEPEQGTFDWNEADAIVNAVADHPKLQLVAVVDSAPDWARNTLATGYDYAPPADPAQYAAFASAFAGRYGDTITYYQIWDEPNIRSHWGSSDPRPAHYKTMLCAAYDSIHAADSSSNVIMAALAPTVETGPLNLSDLLFLRTMYELGGGDCFDAAAAKPYGYNLDPDDRQVDSEVLNFSRWILLREEMVAQGDATKPLWGSNFGWNYLPADWDGTPSIWGSVSAAEQEQFTRDAFRRARDEWPWTGGLILQHWQPDAPATDGINGFAIAPVIDSWLANGPLVPVDDGLLPGLHSPDNAFTTYSENWQVQTSGADYIPREPGPNVGADAVPPDPEADASAVKNQITVQFSGTAFALPVQRDNYTAYLYVTIDGEQANVLPRNRQGDAYIILTSPERTAQLDLILVAEGLSDGVHTAEIIHRPDHGDDRWPIQGYAVATPPDTGRYTRNMLISGVIGVLALLGAGI
ncbi:MAG: hypothetical protein GYB65_18975, partial [Chloroflexi bacterium]|nr:hypothetical protein [Chloroflexota bacterium]